jgi:hypothetical protein
LSHCSNVNKSTDVTVKVISCVVFGLLSAVTKKSMIAITDLKTTNLSIILTKMKIIGNFLKLQTWGGTLVQVSKRSSSDLIFQMNISHSFLKRPSINIDPVLQPDIPSDHFHFSSLLRIIIDGVVYNVVHV